MDVLEQSTLEASLSAGNDPHTRILMVFYVWPLP